MVSRQIRTVNGPVVPKRHTRPPRMRLVPQKAHAASTRQPADAHAPLAPLASAGNLFEGEWREGKPIVKNGDRMSNGGPLDWLNEAVANVSTNLSGQGGGGNYSSVSTHDEDEDDWRRPSHR